MQQQELQKEMQKHVVHLQQLKDYEEKLAQVKEHARKERKNIEVLWSYKLCKSKSNSNPHSVTSIS